MGGRKKIPDFRQIFGLIGSNTHRLPPQNVKRSIHAVELTVFYV